MYACFKVVKTTKKCSEKRFRL